MLKANPKVIGAFVVGGLVLLILGLVTFGSFQFFAQRLPVVMYFQGDLSGLDVGAPLVFRGVQIGTITDVQLHFNSETRQIAIPVFAEIEPERFVVEGPLKGGANLPALVKAGLRAQLATQSLLTGKLMVRIDFFPDTEPRLLGPAGKIPEVPTVPSAMAELQAGFQGLLNKLQEMPLSGLVDDLRKFINNADTAVQDLQTRTVREAAVRALTDAEALMENVNRRVDTLAPASEATMKDTDQAVLEARRVLTEVRPLLAAMQRTAESADRLMNTANDVIQPGSPAYRELTATLKEFAAAARSIRGLADDLERNPDSILFGKATTRITK